MKTKIARFFQIFIILVFLLGSANLQTVFAQDETPVVTEPVVVVTEEVVVEATEVITETLIVEEGTGVPTETPTVNPTDHELEVIADAVDTILSSDLVLVDALGNPLPLASIETQQTLVSNDPWFEDPSDSTKVIAYQTNCDSWIAPLPYTGGKCIPTLTPIQDAVDNAPDGATIHIEAATFTERVSIENRVLTLSGSGPGTVLKAPTTLGESDDKIKGDDYYSLIYIHNNSVVTLSNMLFDGSGFPSLPDNSVFTGILIKDSSANISNITVKNFSNSDSKILGAGIVLDGITNSYVVTVDNNSFLNNEFGIFDTGKTNNLYGIDNIFLNNTTDTNLPILGTNDTGKITICHATSSATNPYNLITVAQRLIVEKNKDGECVPNGHGLHEDDIIPAFTGDECSFAGQGDQTILNNGCVVPAPAITVVKSITSSGPYVEGSTITYSIVVTNTGNVDLTNVTVTDPKAVISGTCSATTLAKEGGSFTCTASHMVNEIDIASGLTYVNTATAKGTYAGVEYSDDGEVTADLDILGCMDKTAINYDQTATIDDGSCIAPAPAITVVKSITSTGPYVLGDTISYNIVVTNTGNVTLNNVSITDPAAVLGTCPVTASLAVGATKTCTATHIVTQADMDKGSFSNTGTGDSDETAPKDSTVETTFTKSPAITVVKSITSTGPYVLGDTISYNIVVTNTGNVTLNNVSITDPAAVLGPCPVTATLAVGATKTCTASHVVVAADVTSGSFTNTGIGDSDETTPVSSSVSSIITAPTIIPPVIPVTGGTPPALLIPVTGGQLIPVTGGTLIVSGLGHSCMTYNNGQVICWGLNASGQVGDGTLLDQHKPVYVKDLEGVLNLTAGSKHTCALMIDGEIWCWGENSSGQLGNNTVVNSNVPVKVEGLPKKVLAITAGEEFTCAQMMNQDVWCWGKNNLGQLNDGTTTNQLKPVKSKLNTMLAQISGGQEFLLGSDFFGSVNEWAKVQAAAVQQLAGSLSISANRWGDTGCAVDSDGSVKCWDSNLISTPIKNTLPAMEVGAGMEHNCVVNNDQTVSCWGVNLSGQLGNGSNTDSLTATLVKNMSKVRALGVGANHTCVLSGTNNAPMCWGENTFGQLGNDSTTNSNLPVFVILPAIQ